MSNTNYLGGIVKVLESPQQKFVGDDIPITQFRAQFPQTRDSIIINLTFWGNLALDVASHYNIDDFILFEGYLSIHLKQNSELTQFKEKKVEVTVFKVYPFLLNTNRLTIKSYDY